MINRALIIDTETNGLEDTAQIIEVGAILYSVTNQCSLIEFATLCRCRRCGQSWTRVDTFQVRCPVSQPRWRKSRYGLPS